MPVNNSLSYFIKNEGSYSINNQNFSNYTMVGGKHVGANGSFELGLAFKESQSSLGGFLEGKYTSPKIADSNWAIESRTRIQADKPYESDKFLAAITQRLAAKGSWDLGKGWSLYQIAGVNSKIPLESNGVQSFTPISLTGIGYNVNKNLNIYTEGELSKTYTIKNDSWGEIAPSVYLGAKYTF